MEKEKTAFAQKKDGYMAALDFVEGRQREEAYIIGAVETADQHPTIDKAKYFLRFDNADEVLVVNKTNEGALRAAYGPAWSGQTIRIVPVERLWDSKPVWGLSVIPMFRCKQCGDYTDDRQTKKCEICKAVEPKPKRKPARGLSDTPISEALDTAFSLDDEVFVNDIDDDLDFHNL